MDPGSGRPDRRHQKGGGDDEDDHRHGPAAEPAGTPLTPFRARLDDATWAAFVADYERRLVALLGPAEPYLYAFKRILVWARFGRN